MRAKAQLIRARSVQSQVDQEALSDCACTVRKGRAVVNRACSWLEAGVCEVGSFCGSKPVAVGSVVRLCVCVCADVPMCDLVRVSVPDKHDIRFKPHTSGSSSVAL